MPVKALVAACVTLPGKATEAKLMASMKRVDMVHNKAYVDATDHSYHLDEALNYLKVIFE